MIDIVRCGMWWVYDDGQNFPFAVVGFNLTGISMEVLRDGSLYGLIRQKKSVYEVVNQLYIAAWYRFYIRWYVIVNNLCQSDSNYSQTSNTNIPIISACVLQEKGGFDRDQVRYRIQGTE